MKVEHQRCERKTNVAKYIQRKEDGEGRRSIQVCFQVGLIVTRRVLIIHMYNAQEVARAITSERETGVRKRANLVRDERKSDCQFQR